MGMVALGCKSDANEYRTCLDSRFLGLICRQWAAGPGVPWDEAENAAKRPARNTCVFEQ